MKKRPFTFTSTATCMTLDVRGTRLVVSALIRRTVVYE